MWNIAQNNIDFLNFNSMLLIIPEEFLFYINFLRGIFLQFSLQKQRLQKSIISWNPITLTKI